MIGIVKSSFQDNRDCEKCNVKVTGHYLAEQGVVFNVRPSGGSVFHSYSGNSDVSQVVVESLEELPDMVTEIMEDVQFNFEDNDMHSWAWRFSDDDDGDHENRESREAMREMRQELRELARELREVEIEVIHAEQDELADLQERKIELETELATTEENQGQVQKEMESYVNERTKERELRKAKRDEERHLRFDKMESIVLNTFCDYSRTMRSLPDNERVSIVVDRGDDPANIYVFKQSQLDSCDSEKTDVRKNALSYAF
jgi:hypothetical protein